MLYEEKTTMNDSIHQDTNKSLTLVLYILYICAIFTAGILAIVALIINYVKRSSVKGTIYESHFTWQIQTFWWYLIWNIIAFFPFLLLFFTEGNPDLFAGTALATTSFFLAIVVISWIWIIYRAVLGLIRWRENKPMSV
jgi:uncharacterized membrane protein